ncbi:septation protein SepH [Nocardioides litoris]|uniref:septation protein SepH n=1 Tax=Nocardioides litoris TaxID=1926648 RepID=UPI00111FD261|nr:septation protein SepH [Nocardioides litoris]
MERAEHVAGHLEPPVPGAPRAARERPLTLTGVSDDRTSLLLADETGATYTLPVTAGLRAAVRGETPRPGRPGQMETPMDSALRPRDIQARIRAGETAEAVAEAAQTSVEKIMPFVGPVLAEREHVAERAQRSTLRRPAGEPSTGARTLGDAVETHLRSLNLDPAAVEWDAWRREDGRWTLTAGFALTERTGTAHLTYDVRGSYVVVDDEDAHWLVGDAVAAPEPARDDLRSARERRLGALPLGAGPDDDELPLGDDAIELVSEPDSPVEAFLGDSPAADDPALREEAAEAAATDPDPEPEPAPEPARRPVQKKKGRASVPSWDEIMFGPGDS